MYSMYMQQSTLYFIIHRSEDTLGLRYVKYVGDGDSSSYSRVKSEQPYGPDVEIVKEECIGHIQKRMGTKLRKLIERKKGIKISLLTFLFTCIHPLFPAQTNCHHVVE